MPTPASPTMPTTWPEPDCDLLVGLHEGGHGVLPAHKPGKPLGHRGLDPGGHPPGLDQLKGLLGLFLALHLQIAQRLRIEVVLDQAVGVSERSTVPGWARLSMREARLMVSPMAV